MAGFPVPVRDTVCGVLLASSLKLSVAARVPTAFGENSTVAEHDAPAANLLGVSGHDDVTVKSEALLATLVKVKLLAWLLVRVTV